MTTTATGACPSCLALVDADDLYCEVCGIGLGFAVGVVGATTAPRSPCTACGENGSPVADGYCPTCGMKQPALRDHLEDVQADAAGVSDRGRRHRRNEDAFALATAADGRVLAVVCDGVSTTASPDEASQRAADAALSALLRALDTPGDGTGKGFDDAYTEALRAVCGVPWSLETNELGPPSCTFLAASAAPGTVELASVGDCRAFWVPTEGEARTLTEDDSWAAEQVRTATMTAEVAYADRRSHGITRWLGSDADPSWEPRRVRFTTQGPGRLVLCTDGLWNYATSAAEVASLVAEGDPLAAGRRLVEYANERGGHDNITVVVVEMAEPTDPEATAKGPLT